MLIVLKGRCGNPVSIDPKLIDWVTVKTDYTEVRTSKNYTLCVRDSPAEIAEKVNNALKQNLRCPWRSLKRR